MQWRELRQTLRDRMAEEERKLRDNPAKGDQHLIGRLEGRFEAFGEVLNLIGGEYVSPQG